MGRQLTPAEMRQVNDAVAGLKSVITKAKRQYAQKQREAACTSRNEPSKQTVCAAA
uniref:Uncharacterized protein n=1 Tax=Desulfovibrio sp. U5L TaxID=596152 RepID=I2Q070_9BACT